MKIIQPVNPDQCLYYELTPERLAILDLIAYTEGTDREIGKTKKGYDILFGGKQFIPTKDHPRVHIPFGKTTSSAAGRYQILDKTWDWLQLGLESKGFKPFPSFAPKYQDQAALYLIDAKRRAINAVDSKDLDTFLRLCSWEWASLPTPEGQGRYGQPIVKPDKIREVYNQLFNLWNA